MYSIEPSIFNFLLKDIILTYGDSLRSRPSVIVNIIKLLHLHCNRLVHIINTTREWEGLILDVYQSFSLIFDGCKSSFNQIGCDPVEYSRTPDEFCNICHQHPSLLYKNNFFMFMERDFVRIL